MNKTVGLQCCLPLLAVTGDPRGVLAATEVPAEQLRESLPRSTRRSQSGSAKADDRSGMRRPSRARYSRSSA